ncbi:SMC family ATPase [Nocardia wallacei]|uniref:SMC family ATPase n=1 Tax=Nocardia wallacei TaxID=480035 RepID=UPI00245894FF|nr:SMC family ATPase [Nocardia wallacei]
MRPLTLKFKGLRSYHDEQEIDFSDVSLMAIIGHTGAGKSSILEAICFALYGGATWDARSPKPLIADGGNGTATAALTFRARSKDWRVTRTASTARPATHELVCLDDPSVERLDSATAVDAQIVHLVGLTYTAFLKAVILPQGRFQDLLQEQKAKRTPILQAALGLELLTDIRAQAASTRDRLASQLIELQRQRAPLLPDPDTIIKDTVAELAALTDQITRMRSAHTSYTDAADAHAEATRRASTLRSTAQQLAQRIPSDTAEQYEHLTRRRSELTAQISTIDAQVAQAQSDEARLGGVLAAANDAGVGVASTASLLNALQSLLRDLPEIDADERDLAQQQADIDTSRKHLEERKRAHEAVIQSAEQAQQRADDAHAEVAAATRTLDHHRSLLRDARQAAHRAESATTSEHDARREERQAAEALSRAETAAAQVEEHLETARAHVDGANRANAAVHAAEGHGPGDPCPLCAQPLPADFQIPESADIAVAQRNLDDAEQQAKTRRKQLSAAEKTHSAAAAQLDTAAAETHRATSARDAAIESLTADVAALDLTQPDDAILAASQLVLGKAKAAKDVADRAASAARDHRIKDDTEIRAAEDAIASRHATLTKSLAALSRRRNTAAETYNATPPHYRTSDEMTPAAIGHAVGLVKQHHHDLDETSKSLHVAQQTVKMLRTQKDAKTRNIRDNIDAPAQRIARDLERLSDRAASITLLTTPVPVPARPEPATVDADAHWATEVIAAVQQICRACHHEADTQETSAAQAHAAMASALTTAHVATVEELNDRLDHARAHQLTAQTMLDRAQAEQPRAAELDRRISIIEPEIASLTELCGLLLDGRFPTTVVHRRQRALLGIASEILLDMTQDRFSIRL